MTQKKEAPAATISPGKRGLSHMFIVRVYFKSHCSSMWVYSMDEALEFIAKEREANL